MNNKITVQNGLFNLTVAYKYDLFFLSKVLGSFNLLVLQLFLKLFWKYLSYNNPRVSKFKVEKNQWLK